MENIKRFAGLLAAGLLITITVLICIGNLSPSIGIILLKVLSLALIIFVLFRVGRWITAGPTISHGTTSRTLGILKRTFILVAVGIMGLVALAWFSATVGNNQFSKVVERTRQGEAKAFIDYVREAQERRRSSAGSYVISLAEISQLALPASLGMKYFAIVKLSESPNCKPSYVLTLRRLEKYSAPAKYEKSYLVSFDSCDGHVRYPDCPRCTADFGD